MEEKDRIDGVSGGFGKLAAPRREKTRTDCSKTCGGETGLETFLKLKKTLMRNLVREIWSETDRSQPEEGKRDGINQSLTKSQLAN